MDRGMEGAVGVGIRFLHPSCCLLSKKSIIVLLTKLHKMLYNPLGAAAQSASDEQTWSELGQACPSEAMQEQCQMMQNDQNDKTIKRIQTDQMVQLYTILSRKVPKWYGIM